MLRQLVADLPVGLSSNKSQVGDVVRFSPRVGRLEHGLRKDMMELESVLGSGMVESNCQL
jgi:hypothetical protein